MYILNKFTDSLSLLGIIYFIKQLITLITICAIVALIIMSSIDILKSVGKPDELKKHFSTMIKRFLYCIILFLLPNIINIFFEITGTLNNESIDIWSDANSSNITTLRKIRDEELKADEILYNELLKQKQEENKKNVEKIRTELEKIKENNNNTSSSSADNQTYNLTRDEVVSLAISYVGKTPYVYGGNSLETGVDCSSFVQLIYKKFGVNLPRTAAEQSNSCTEVSLNNLKKGDLLFYSNGSNINHVTMYIGDDKVVHASSPRVGITISNISYRKAIKARSCIND